MAAKEMMLTEHFHTRARLVPWRVVIEGEAQGTPADVKRRARDEIVEAARAMTGASVLHVTTRREGFGTGTTKPQARGIKHRTTPNGKRDPAHVARMDVAAWLMGNDGRPAKLTRGHRKGLRKAVKRFGVDVVPTGTGKGKHGELMVLLSNGMRIGPYGRITRLYGPRATTAEAAS